MSLRKMKNGSKHRGWSLYRVQSKRNKDDDVNTTKKINDVNNGKIRENKDKKAKHKDSINASKVHRGKIRMVRDGQFGFIVSDDADLVKTGNLYFNFREIIGDTEWVIPDEVVEFKIKTIRRDDSNQHYAVDVKVIDDPDFTKLSSSNGSLKRKREELPLDNDAKWALEDMEDFDEADEELMDDVPRSAAFWKLHKMGMVEAPKKPKVSSSINQKRKKRRKIKENLNSKDSKLLLRSELNEVTASGVESADAESSESTEPDEGNKESNKKEDGNWISSERFWRAGFCQICRQEGHEPIECPRLHEKLDRKKRVDIGKDIKVIKDDDPSKTQKESDGKRESKDDDVNTEDKHLKDKKKKVIETKKNSKTKTKKVKASVFMKNRKLGKSVERKVFRLQADSKSIAQSESRNPVAKSIKERVEGKTLDRFQKAESKRKGKLHDFVDSILVDKVGFRDLDAKPNLFVDKRKKALKRKRYGKRKV